MEDFNLENFGLAKGEVEDITREEYEDRLKVLRELEYERYNRPKRELEILSSKGLTTEQAEVIFYDWGGYDIAYKPPKEDNN